MKRPSRLRYLILCFCCWSCIDFTELEDLDGGNYQPSLAIPVLDSDITLGQILESYESANTIEIDSDGLIHFIYKTDFLSRKAEDIFSDISGFLPETIPVLSNNLSVPLDALGDFDIDQLDFKSGDFTYNLLNTTDRAFDLDFVFTSVVDAEGNPFTFTVSLPAYSGSGAFPRANNQDAPLDLSGYFLIPNDNRIELEYTTRDANGDFVVPSSFFIGLQNLEFSYAEGYLGTLPFEGGQDSVAIDFFDDFVDGRITFEDPKVTFAVENSFGVPTRAIVNSFIVATVDGQRLQVVSTAIDDGIDFPFPSLDQMGQVALDSFVFDQSNSNLVNLLAEGPILVAYDVDAIINPDMDASIRGFVTDSSFYNVQMIVDLPLFGQATTFTITDTLDFELGEDLEDLSSLELKVITENELGVTVTTQVYFMDESGSLLDSLYQPNPQVIAGAPVDATGLNTGTAIQTDIVLLDSTRLDRIQTSTQLLLSAGFSTEDNLGQSVKVIDTQKINVKIGAIATLK